MHSSDEDSGEELLFKIILWLVTEMLLNLLGLDSIADYGEFVSGRHLDRENTMNSAIVVFLKSPL